MSNTREIRVPFGLLNIAGLMETSDVSIDQHTIAAKTQKPLFCHQSYKIKPTLNSNFNPTYGMYKDESGSNRFYQKKFRREVLWDFGDGHTEEGYSVQHAYERPGRYKISCTFYDINRRAWKNTYYIEVVVKEILPTVLRFDKAYTKTEIKCSRVERIAKIEAILSKNCKEDLQIIAKRIFSEDKSSADYEEMNKKYLEMPSEIFKHVRKYWTFLKNNRQLMYQSDQVVSDKLQPSDFYTPEYITLYGNFYYDKSDNDEPLKLSVYQVIPYKNIDENLKTIRIINPNCNIDNLLDSTDSESDYNDKYTKVINIQQVYLEEQLPDYVSLIGKRGWVDIYYKNDYKNGVPNTFTFHYDIETKNITKELLSSENYLNMMPLGLTVNVISNNFNDVKIGISLDGFLRQLGEEYTVDEYLINSLIKGIDLDFYFFPYIEYNNQITIIEGTDISIGDESSSEFVTQKRAYYIPKDCEITSIIPSQESSIKDNSIYNNERGVEEIEPWMWRLNFILKDCFKFIFTVGVNNTSKTVPLYKDSLIDTDSVNIPTEKRHREDINELVNVYMTHPMFEETPTIKDFFKVILSGNDMLNYTLTRSSNFLDDYGNVKTCYLSSLISTLKMMGEDVLEFETGSFEGVNDLRDFVRILSMNHSDLVGHVVKEKHDINIKYDKKGKNVGDKILTSDILTIRNGKILKIERDGKIYDYTSWNTNGVEMIVYDKYTHESKIVNFGLCSETSVKLENYQPSWGWNLLLPSRFNDCIYKLNQNKTSNILSQRDIARTYEVISQLMNGYYDFYILNPDVSEKRVGNFLETDSITEDIDVTESWESKWGICHEILMKILKENGNLHLSNVVFEDDVNAIMPLNLHDSEDFGLFEYKTNDISCTVYENNKLSYNYDFQGEIQMFGIIYGKGEHVLELQLTNGLINGQEIRTVEDLLQFHLEISEKGEIHPTKQVFEIESDDYKGELSIKLCGKIRNNKGVLEGLLWDISIELFTNK